MACRGVAAFALGVESGATADILGIARDDGDRFDAFAFGGEDDVVKLDDVAGLEGADKVFCAGVAACGRSAASEDDETVGRNRCVARGVGLACHFETEFAAGIEFVAFDEACRHFIAVVGIACLVGRTPVAGSVEGDAVTGRADIDAFEQCHLVTDGGGAGVVVEAAHAGHTVDVDRKLIV